MNKNGLQHVRTTKHKDTDQLSYPEYSTLFTSLPLAYNVLISIKVGHIVSLV